MQIVVEYVLLENFFINLIVLKTTALLLHEKGRLFFLSAFLGACLTVVMPLLFLSSFGWVLVQVGIMTITICISFRFRRLKKFLQIFATQFASAFLYGGAAYFFEGAFGTRSLLMILAVIVAVFVVVKLLCKAIFRKRNVEKFCYDVEIQIGGSCGKWKAFLDSGNMLTDPLTDSPVSLINYRVFSTLFKEIDLEDVLRHTDKLKMLKFAHYINFNTLGSNNKILVFQADKMAVAGKVLEGAMLGLCLKNFNEAFGSDVILSSSVC